MISNIVKNKLSFDFILALVLVALSLLLNQLLFDKVEILQRWNSLFYDLEYRSNERAANDDIVIVAIDDISLQSLGRWPWPRITHAALIDKLTEAGVAAIGLDILFMEPDLANPDHDLQLGAAIHRNGHVVLPVLTAFQDQSYLIARPLVEISEYAQLAHVNLHFDQQGVVRKLDLQLDLDEAQPLPAMSLALSRQLERPGELSEQDLKTPVLISYSRYPHQFQQISYVDVLLNPDIQQTLQGKVILIGLTAGGVNNHFATPVSTNQQLMSGIVFQANALATIQSGQIIHPLSQSLYTLVTLVLIVIPVLLFRFYRPSVALLLAFVFSALTCIFSFFMLNMQQLWFTPVPTLLCLILSYPLWSWRRIENLNHFLFAEHEKASATLNAIGEAVITTDNKGHIEFMNPVAEKMLACTLADARTQYFTETCRIVEQEEAILWNRDDLATKKKHSKICIIRNQQNEEYTVRISTRPIRTKNGLQTGFVFALNDLTEITNINKKIAFVATHDDLTGLPNRVLLQDRLEQALNNSKQEGEKFAVLFIDLDGFKKINDAMGHSCGDLILQQVAMRLQKWVRQSDSISRWGGDEFIILMVNIASPNVAAEIAQKILQSLGQSFIVKQQEVFVTPSIGISLFPEDGENSEIILAKADKAMYNVKKNGCNNFCFYSLNQENQAREKLLMETELHQALKFNQFEVYYQPQIDLLSYRLIGFEALIRWQHPEKGLIMPGVFIPLAEELGLIASIGEWVITAVCQQLQISSNQNLPFVKIAINLSAQQFSQNNLVKTITREIKKYGVAKGALQVEITESMMIQDMERVNQILNELKAAGISIAIDDFGTGYSSLEYLKRFPIDELKIDKSFVDNILHNSDDANIVRAVTELGHNMKMRIIAEGIETKEQALFLQQHHCDYGQGYFFSKPVHASEVEQTIEKFSHLAQS